MPANLTPSGPTTAKRRTAAARPAIIIIWSVVSVVERSRSLDQRSSAGPTPLPRSTASGRSATILRSLVPAIPAEVKYSDRTLALTTECGSARAGSAGAVDQDGTQPDY